MLFKILTEVRKAPMFQCMSKGPMQIPITQVLANQRVRSGSVQTLPMRPPSFQRGAHANGAILVLNAGNVGQDNDDWYHEACGGDFVPADNYQACYGISYILHHKHHSFSNAL